MLETVTNGGIERLDDLHVDRIDDDWKQRAAWVAAGVTAYPLAVRICADLGLDVTVGLAFSLLDAKDDSLETFETQKEFESQLDWSPPSLYLFKAGDHQHLSGTVRVNPLPESLMSLLPQGTKSFLLRWAAENGEERRSVIVEA